MRDTLKRLGKALRATPQALEAFRGFGSSYFAFPRSVYVDGAYIEATQASYAYIYASQENVRIVVNKIATVAAAHSLRCYERDSNDDREEASDHPAMRTMREPNDWQAQKELTEAYIRDKLIYDDAYLWDMGADNDGRRFVIRVPPPSIGVKTNNRLVPSGYRIKFQDGTWLDLAPEEIIHWRGYSAGDNRLGVPPLETLRTILAESAARKAQSIEQVKAGLVKGGIVQRPLEAPPWSTQALERFSEHFASRLRGVVAGQTPVLDEGMEFLDVGITPRQAEMLETRKFDLAAVALVYGINPALFSEDGNLDAARRELEEDVVMPMLGRLEEVFTHQLLRRRYNDRTHFFRFRARMETDLGKLFEAGSKATGGSTLTPNEYRKDYLDKPPIPGGDEIVQHPGSQGGGTPEAPDSEDRGRPPIDPTIEEEEKALRASIENTKAMGFSIERQKQAVLRRNRYAVDHAEVLRKHFRRQLKDTSGAPVDAKRWNDELADDLTKLGALTVSEEGDAVSRRLMGSFDKSQTVNYVRAGAEAMARNVNAATADQIREASMGKADELDFRSDILQSAIDTRADSLAMNRATGLAAFAALEAGRQNPPERGERVKTWVWSQLPNSRHTELAGDQVPLYTPFSNGMQHPGDPKGGAEQNANCECALDII